MGFWLTLLVTVTFYLRNKIGQKAFHTIHVFSLTTTVQGLLSGTDTGLPAVQGM